LKNLDKIFVFFFPWGKLTEKEKKLIKLREKLRKEKKFEKSDKIREELKKIGIYLMDTNLKTVVINLN
ncbi:MAG: cysteine--tRNA ligase, partial [Patescibacteria group bacterium]